MNTKTALIIGSTGLVGRQLTQLLLKGNEYGLVIAFVRRSSGISHPKLEERIVDFTQPESWKEHLKGDVIFSCMGTTIKVAGSQDAQWQVDYTFQWNAASLAAANGVGQLVLVSAASADSSSRLFYNRMKGELDEAVASLGFKQIDIVRPSILKGDRGEFRLGEKIGLMAMEVLRIIPGLRAYRPIRDAVVARAMIRSAQEPHSDHVKIHTLEEVHHLSKRYVD